MRIIRGSIKDGEYIKIEDDLHFDKKIFAKNNTLKDIKNKNVIAYVKSFEDLLHVDLIIDTTLTLVCSYTCDNFDKKFHIKDSIDITDDKNKENGELIFNPNSIIKLDDYIYSIIYCEIPINPIKPGAKRPKSTKDY